MIRSSIARAAGAVVAGGLLLSGAPALGVVQPAAFSAMVVLGDSLSDDGNVFALTGGQVPAAPYFNGRFSNGRVAVEYLADGLLGAGSPNFHNLAFGGARTGLGGAVDAFVGRQTGMLAQLADLQTTLGGAPADSNALYFVWGGANDLRNGGSIAGAVGNLSGIVNTLYGMGARKFFLPNLPDLGLTPEARQAGGTAQATAASEFFNLQLSAAYGTLAAQWADETFYFFDAMQAQRDITNGSPGNGFSNVSDDCWVPQAGTLCANPGAHLYFDTIHPTAVAHQILGNQMLAAVPEPQTMLLMAAGVAALLGWQARRRA